jgi:hypothetical protein
VPAAKAVPVRIYSVTEPCLNSADSDRNALAILKDSIRERKIGTRWMTRHGAYVYAPI